MGKKDSKREYNNESISALKGADRVRKRPEVIFGSNGLEGCCHSVFEILSNSIDEAREGYGNLITVTRYADGSIQVKDNGRGIPLDYNQNEMRYNWELVFCELYAGGKYKNNTGENYEFSLGLNGLGSCATQYSSRYMDVTVFRDGHRFFLHFEKGENVGGLQKNRKRGETGTTIRWLPDLDVFTDINIPLTYFQDVLKKQAVVNAGLTFKLIYETEDKVLEFDYCYENGIMDYVNELHLGKNITDPVVFSAERVGRDREDKPDYKVRLNVAFCFSNEVQAVEYYHNSSFLEHGGSPDKALRSAFLGAIDGFLRQNGKYNKQESKITAVDILDSLVFVSNSFSTMTSYENQTKKAINNKFIQEAMTEFLKENLNIYFIENRKEAEKIANQILLNKRSREASEKARTNIKKKLSATIDVTNRVAKFVDCRSRDVKHRELYIVEGDSALGACKQGRNAEFQAIMPVRGKILNCLKADYDKIFKNEIIVDLMRVLGCGIEARSKHNKEFNTFSPENLRWDKIIICTDADVDGFQIRALILTMLYILTPSLITMGKVYIALSPLFEITVGEKSYFAYTEQEKVKILNKLKNKKYAISRSKGLGENQPEMMWQTTMNPETRRLIKVMPYSEEETKIMFDTLLGDDLSARRNFISEKGPDYLEQIEVV